MASLVVDSRVAGTEVADDIVDTVLVVVEAIPTTLRKSKHPSAPRAKEPFCTQSQYIT